MERFPKRSRSSQADKETNVILRDVEIVGTVRFKDDVVIDGKIDGEIVSDGSVTVGREAIVNADIHGSNVLVEGTVAGDIHATGRLDLSEHSEVTGHVSAEVLTMQAGAVLIGSSSVGAAARKVNSQDDAGAKIHPFRQAG